MKSLWTHKIMKKENESLVKIPAGKIILEGNLNIPKNAKGIVLFAHGSGSSRFSPRNKYVADVLNKANIATLLIDLLTKEEEKIDDVTAHLRFDIDLLSERLIYATDWLKKNPDTTNLKIGYFGASTGAAAALVAAAKLQSVYAIVSRGGRPDLARDYLENVKAPTLLIVGGNDTIVIDLNKEAMKKLSIENKLEIVKGASHLFEEPGALEKVAKLAAYWFKKYLK